MSNEATHKNILAIKSHAEETRKQQRETQDKVKGLVNTIDALRGVVENLQLQVQALQIKLFTGGPTDGN